MNSRSEIDSAEVNPVASPTRVLLRTSTAPAESFVALDFPETWSVKVVPPRFISPINWTEISASLEHPYGQPSLRQLARLSLRPLIVVGGPLRSVPIARVMPVLLEHFREAGVPAASLRILLPRPTERTLSPEEIKQAIGPEAASSCRVLLHDPEGETVIAGHTSRGTRIEVNRELLLSDLVIGVGGLLPSQIADFAGGLSLSLEALSNRSLRLLGRPENRARRSDASTTFRSEANEIARMIGLKTTISVMINTDQDIVRILCGDPDLYEPDADQFAQQNYVTPAPHHSVRLVVSNAYPEDRPRPPAQPSAHRLLLDTTPVASRVLVTSGSGPTMPKQSSDVGHSPSSRLRATLRNMFGRHRANPRPIHTHRAGDSWRAILEIVNAEQLNRSIEVWVYPFAALQIVALHEIL